MKLLFVFCGLLAVALASNPEENLELNGRDAGLHGGDMLLTPYQEFVIESRAVHVRASTFTKKWPGGVLVYEIESSLSSEAPAMAVIHSALQEWEQKTCVRFKKRTTETAYVSFYKGSGCWSYLGRTGGKQLLSLASACWRHGIVIHEIGHALGFFHEQSRPDRDNYVTIEWDNIIDDRKSNFKKYGNNIINSLGTPYDYGSIMHYSSHAFSKNGQPTIVAKTPGVTIGQRKGLSAIDAQQMNLLYSCQTECRKPLGMESGLIKDSQITASSQYDGNHAAIQGRLNVLAGGGKTGGWSARTNDVKQWIQVDLVSDTKVTQIVTQGRNAVNQWVTKYRLQHSDDGVNFHFYHLPGHTSPAEFDANQDRDTPVSHQFSPPILARYIRLRPTAWYNHISMRMELYGCLAVCRKPLGMESRLIKDSQITASSQYDGNHAAIQGRLNFLAGGGKTGGWSARTNDVKQWIQVDLVSDTKVTQIVTQGRNAVNQWVTKYRLQHSDDGVNFHFYHLPGHTSPAEFDANQDRDTPVSHQLSPPILARYIRLRPAAWYNHISMRMELYGCLAVKSVKCTFDGGLCSGWSQAASDQFDWTVGGGTTPSYETGPSTDHSGSGKYIYIETSSPRVPNDKAVVVFNGYTGGPACLSFYYHMYGQNINQLNVKLGSTNVFQKSGSQGNEWKKAEVTINGHGNINFEGLRGSSWKGDIAIDDFSLTGGSCKGGGEITLPQPANPTQLFSPGNCGKKPNVRIVGGTAAMKNSWPWQAMLQTTFGLPFCGGSLIAPQWVVSAAHCVHGMTPRSVTIRMGAHMRVTNVGTEQDLKVAKIISHPTYKPLTYSHDLALIKLEKPAILNKAVGVVCVPDGNSPAMPIDSSNRKCWITGWGRQAFGGAKPDRLMQASVPLVSKARCLKGYPNKIDDSMLCAGLDQGRVDACQGDSGGPLVCEYNGQWFLEGATSWVNGCAGPMKYGVYARVRYFKNWIDQAMKNN